MNEICSKLTIKTHVLTIKKRCQGRSSENFIDNFEQTLHPDLEFILFLSNFYSE